MKHILLFFLIIFFMNQMLSSIDRIIIKQDKNGKIILTNEPIYKKKPKRKTYSRPSSTGSVPYVYLNKITKLANQHRLRKDLIIAVARAESSFNPKAVSRKGAVGIMQLMYSTAKQYGIKNRFNVDQNLEGGVRHLKYLYSKYSRNLPLTLAAYNAGEEAVKKYKGIPPYRETRKYIKKVIKYMGLGYSGYFKPKTKTRIYKYITQDGKIIITDTLPAKVNGKIEIIR